MGDIVQEYCSGNFPTLLFLDDQHNVHRLEETLKDPILQTHGKALVLAEKVIQHGWQYTTVWDQVVHRDNMMAGFAQFEYFVLLDMKGASRFGDLRNFYNILIQTISVLRKAGYGGEIGYKHGDELCLLGGTDLLDIVGNLNQVECLGDRVEYHRTAIRTGSAENLVHLYALNARAKRIAKDNGEFVIFE